MPDFFAEYHPGKADKRAPIVLPELSDESGGSDEVDEEQLRAVEMASAKAKEVDKTLDLRAASEGKGNARQLFNLGAHLAKEGNMTGAVRWFRRSARGGYAKAEYNLGACLVSGPGGDAMPLKASRYILAHFSVCRLRAVGHAVCVLWDYGNEEPGTS